MSAEPSQRGATTWAGALSAWLEERAGSPELRHLVEAKVVPRHRFSVFYYLGGMALFLFAIQLGTGLLLLLYYEPGVSTAYESVKRIAGEIPFGWLIRSLHRWSADLFIGVIALHMFTAFVMRAYRRPRELTWLTGIATLGLAFAFGFSGYLLPWDEISFFATSVGTAVAGSFPLVGPTLLQVLRGGEDVTGATLARFFALHVVVLPFAALALLGGHLLLVQKHGMSVPEGETEARTGRPPRSLPFFPNFLLRDAIGWAAALGVLAALAALFPWDLGQKADPFAPAPAGIRPEWYFAWMFQTLKWIPSHVLGMEGELLGLVAFGLGGLVLVIIPLLDPGRDPRRGRVLAVLGWLVVAYVAAATAVVYLKHSP